MAHIKLGAEVRDTISGFRGKVTQRTLFLHGCSRCLVQPPCGEDGKLPESQAFNESQLLPIHDGQCIPDLDPHRFMGKKVKDRITKFKGTVVAASYYTDSMCRLTVQPEELFEGRTTPPETFDEAQLEPMESVPKENPRVKPPGGPGNPIAQAGATPR